MKLQTKIKLESKQLHQIDYNSKVLLLGSCFSENIGNKFNYFKFQSLQNPFGILFQPQAIQRLITSAVSKKEYTSNDVFFHNEQYHCFDTHSKLSDSKADRLLSRINKGVRETYQFIEDATHIIITLGSAWTYRHIKTDTYVTNCHKIPQKEFLKELCSIAQILESLKTIVSSVRSVNPDVNFIFTVSPVRHVKDGFVENTFSKSHLISAIHNFLNQNSSRNNRQSHYFPSYEIMMDELRDYRFYKSDMLHPNETAINYIWEKFSQVWIDKSSEKIMSEVETIQKGLAHKPFNQNSEAHKKFLSNLKRKIMDINAIYSHFKF